MKIENCKIENLLSYYLKVYGCQYNEWDGAKLDYILQKLGLTASSEQEADIVFILSCSVRKSAVDRVMSTVKNNSGKKVIVTGCILEADKKKYENKNVTLWDINKPEELLNIISNCHSGPDPESRKILKQAQDDNIIIKPFDSAQKIPFVAQGKQFSNNGAISSAYLPIITGCNNFCSYCAVPYVRGRERSRDFDEIVNDFKKLVKAGHKEITLLGQNVNSYSKQNTDNSIQKKRKNDFAELLKVLNDVPGDFLIGFTSNHPKDMTDEIIDVVKNLPKVKKEIHLPFQSGSNKILKAMNRPYTREKYLALIKKLKKEIPEIKITTDVIVGFPGETEGDFQKTVDIIKKVGFAQSFTNKYSPRSGTASFKLGDPILWQEKQRRWGIINEIINKRINPGSKN